MHLRDQKTALRTAMEERLRRMDAPSRAAESRSVARRLLAYIPTGSTICAYSALGTEPNLSLLIDALLERNDTVYLPCFHNNTLSFHRITDRAELIAGALGILEPPVSHAELVVGEADIAIIPGRAFDRNGGRLGRGNGGYDIWLETALSQNPSLECIGACFECQVVHAVPLEPHDRRMHALATARSVAPCSPLSPAKGGQKSL